jgi:hypothetical protein
LELVYDVVEFVPGDVVLELEYEDVEFVPGDVDLELDDEDVELDTGVVVAVVLEQGVVGLAVL